MMKTHLLLQVFSTVNDALLWKGWNGINSKYKTLYNCRIFSIYTVHLTMVSMDQKFCKDIENV